MPATVPRAHRASPVSYTHLDVYKRQPEYMEKVMARYAFKDWESVLASIGHGGLKEGQVINKMSEEDVYKRQWIFWPTILSQ